MLWHIDSKVSRILANSFAWNLSCQQVLSRRYLPCCLPGSTAKYSYFSSHQCTVSLFDLNDDSHNSNGVTHCLMIHLYNNNSSWSCSQLFYWFFLCSHHLVTLLQLPLSLLLLWLRTNSVWLPQGCLLVSIYQITLHRMLDRSLDGCSSLYGGKGENVANIEYLPAVYTLVAWFHPCEDTTWVKSLLATQLKYNVKSWWVFETEANVWRPISVCILCCNWKVSQACIDHDPPLLHDKSADRISCICNFDLVDTYVMELLKHFQAAISTQLKGSNFSTNCPCNCLQDCELITSV